MSPLASKYAFTIETVGVTSQAEVTQAVDTLISKGVNCISNLTDNTVVGVLPAILEKTNDAGVPVYGSEIEQMKLGCVAGRRAGLYQAGHSDRENGREGPPGRGGLPGSAL